VQAPEVLTSMNPLYAVEFFANNQSLGFLILGSVVLVITGGEALYADMGHFGRSAIRWSWYCVVLPGLLLNYWGQGALLLSNPDAIKNPFYYLAPEWMLVPLVVLATLATVIASQALISGVFSIAKQAMQLGFSPRMRIVHTSSREIGQIYVPTVNWLLMAVVLWLVMTFKTSSGLASAYGIAVTGTMAITSILAFIVAINHWKWGVKRSLFLFGLFFAVDFSFFYSNLAKIEEGGWISLALSAGIYLLLSTWRKGRRILGQKLLDRSVSIEDFLKQLKENPVHKVKGAAIYMAGDSWGVPFPLLHLIKHNKVIHEQVAILTIKTKEVPWVPKKERVQIESLENNFYRIIAFYGFMEIPKIKHILDACRERGIPFSITETTFVLGRETILATGDPTLSVWRERLFAFMSRNAERPTSFFKIPPNQVIEVGIQVEI
jgi:KUP system potassium uptake protein